MPVPVAAAMVSTVAPVVSSSSCARRMRCEGQDIYAVTAPLVTEALRRVLTGRTTTVGVASAGETFDTPDFLQALDPHITVDRHPQKRRPVTR